MPLHELITVQLQERLTLLTQDSIGHLQKLYVGVLLLSSVVESE